MIRAERLALLLLLLVLTASLEPAHGQAREETNVVYGMHYGTALLMDVAYPDSANGYGVLFVPGSGWHETGRYGATPLKELGFVSDREEVLTEAGYTVFTINHRAAPRFTYPAAVEDARFLLVHGTADQVVPVEQSVRMRDTLVRRGVPVQLVTLDGVGHGAFEPDQFDYGRQLVPWLGQCLRVRSARAPGRRETK